MLQTDGDSSQRLADLPGDYTNIQPAILKIAKPIVPQMKEPHQTDDSTFNEFYQEVHQWMVTVEKLLKKDELGADEMLLKQLIMPV